MATKKRTTGRHARRRGLTGRVPGTAAHRRPAASIGRRPLALLVLGAAVLVGQGADQIQAGGALAAGAEEQHGTVTSVAADRAAWRDGLSRDAVRGTVAPTDVRSPLLRPTMTPRPGGPSPEPASEAPAPSGATTPAPLDPTPSADPDGSSGADPVDDEPASDEEQADDGAADDAAAHPTVPSTGVPGPTNTGVPAGVQLKVHSGDVVVRTAGTVISGLDVRGTISVYAANVTIKNTIVRFGAKAPAKGVTVAGIHSYSTGLKVIDSEVAATTPTPDYTGVMGSGFTLTRVDIHDVVDPVHVATYNPVVVQDSWLHDNSHWTADPNWGGKPSHDDSIQIVAGKSVKILRNSISGAYNSGIQFNQSASKSVSDVLVSQNTMGGGGCTVNIAPSDRPMAGVVIAHNKFRHDQRVKDCAIIGAESAPSVTVTGNSWLGDGDAVRIR